MSAVRVWCGVRVSPGLLLLLLLAVLLTLVFGLWHWHQGWSAQADAAARTRVTQGEPARRRLRSRLEARLRSTGAGRELEYRLAAAGVDIGLSDALLITLCVMAVTAALANLILPTWLALVVGALSLLGLRAFLEFRRRRRREEFVAQLPELARVMSNASSAGLALPSSLAMAASELGEPAAEVIGRVVEELQLGQTVDGALENLERRMPSREVGVLVSTLVIQQRAGGDVVTALRDMAETLEARKDLRREVATIMAGAIFTSYVVAALGLGSLLLVNAIQPGVIEDMVANPVGQAALVVGLALYALGFTLVRRTTRIET